MNFANMIINIHLPLLFLAGCYWGTEKFFIKDFNKSGNKVLGGKVGFMHPNINGKKNPTYREVCTGSTGHVEVYDLTFDGNEQTYEDLVKHFFKFHDPTTVDRQGNDRGTQYASAIFVYDDKQFEIATKVKNELNELLKKKNLGYQGNTAVTEIHKATTFYPAQDDHQEYLEKNPWGYCNHGYRFKDWPK